MPTWAHSGRMSTAPGIVIRAVATDPVEPIHDYNIPINPHRRSPSREYYPGAPRRNPPHRPIEKSKKPPVENEGHVDDYA